MQDCARILQVSCMQDLHAICPFSCTILAQSCTYLARNGARFCKSCCKNNYLHFLHIFCKILQELVQDCARKGTYCVQVLHARFLQDSCMILQVRFCWASLRKECHQNSTLTHCLRLPLVKGAGLIWRAIMPIFQILMSVLLMLITATLVLPVPTLLVASPVAATRDTLEMESHALVSGTD